MSRFMMTLISCLLLMVTTSGCAFRTSIFMGTPVPVGEPRSHRVHVREPNGQFVEREQLVQTHHIPRRSCREERWFGGYYGGGAGMSALGGTLLALGFVGEDENDDIFRWAGAAWIAAGTLMWLIPMIIDLTHREGEVFRCRELEPLTQDLPILPSVAQF